MDSDKLLQTTIDLDKKLRAFIKIAFHYVKAIIWATIYYSFLLWIFLNIYQYAGFERTLIILLIGIFYVRVKRHD